MNLEDIRAQQNKNDNKTECEQEGQMSGTYMVLLKRE